MCLSASWQLAAQIRNICATKWLAEYPMDTDAMAATAAQLSFLVSPIIFPASSGAVAPPLPLFGRPCAYLWQSYLLFNILLTLHNSRFAWTQWVNYCCRAGCGKLSSVVVAALSQSPGRAINLSKCAFAFFLLSVLLQHLVVVVVVVVVVPAFPLIYFSCVACVAFVAGLLINAARVTRVAIAHTLRCLMPFAPRPCHTLSH